MRKNEIPEGVFPWTTTLNYSTQDVILQAMSQTRHQGSGDKLVFSDHWQQN